MAKDTLSDYKRKKRIKEILLLIFKYFFLISIGYIVLFQLFYMIAYAIRPYSDMYNPSVVWITKNPMFQNFKDVIASMEYLKSFWNTFSVQVLSAFIEVASCAIVAYGFARFNFPCKNLLFMFVIITILVPSQMIAVPMYLNFADFDFFGILKLIYKVTGSDLRPNLLDSGWVFYLPSIFASGLRSGLFIFIYRQFFVGMPKELEEAAAIDGASPVKTFLHVIIPSSGVAILTVSIFSLVWHWNEYNLSVLYFDENHPLSVRLSTLSQSLSVMGLGDNRGVRMAACLLFILPVLLVYIVLQRNFIQSIDRVGIVG